MLKVTSGFLFRARPTLMVADTSAAVMDAIFQSREEDARGRLLKIMQDFLFSQVAKHVEGQKGVYIITASDELFRAVVGGKATKGKGKAVNMDELIGTSDGFADSGYAGLEVDSHLAYGATRVSLAIVQRYIEPILAAVLSQSPAIQASAMDILSFTVRQGLAHPMQVLLGSLALSHLSLVLSSLTVLSHHRRSRD
jgi:cohesin loading factor subunit SCC2